MVKAEAVSAEGQQKARKSFGVKILALNSYVLNILPTLFAKPAPVKPFRGVVGRGVSLATLNLPKRISLEHPLPSAYPHFFPATSPQDIFHPHA